MCNIALKFGEKFSSKQINELSEIGEKGSGIFLVEQGLAPHLIRRMKRKELKEEYYALPPNPLFSLYHSRWPSRGEGILSNVQPFYDEKTGIVVCHNGTITNTDYFVYELLKLDDCAFLRNSPSDTLILFHLLKHFYEPKSSIKILNFLIYLNDNFVFIDTQNRLIYLIGHFAKRKEYIERSFQANKIFTVLDYYGVKVAGDDLVEKEKETYTTYNGYSYYHNGTWYRQGKSVTADDKKDFTETD